MTLSKPFIVGILIGAGCMALWLQQRRRKTGVVGGLLFVIYYLIVIQLMQMAGCFQW